MTYRKKLIEVAMPLEAINDEASRRKRKAPKGYPTQIHKWWAQRPLAACRAVLFSQLVDDPGSVHEEFETEAEQGAERKRLHELIERLVPWEASNDERVMSEARREIARSIARWRADRGEDEAVDARMRFEQPSPDEVNRYLAEKAPPIHDPFCGGGSIPLEAQRLGLRAIASDLNPVAVLITKALIEIPPRFAGMEPVNPEWRSRPEAERRLKTWRGAEGLAEDVRYYGRWMRDEAEKRIGHLYPKVTVTEEMAAGRDDLKKYVGRELTVIAWLWARTVTCPNPACGATMPLLRSFWLSKKKSRLVWLEPSVEERTISFGIRRSSSAPQQAKAIGIGTGFVNDKGKKVQATFRCAACESGAARGGYIDDEAAAGRMGTMPLAIVAEGKRERVYLPFGPRHLEAALVLTGHAAKEVQHRFPSEPCRGTFASNAQGRRYGFHTFADYFTPRQLVALTAFSDLVAEARERTETDAGVARPHDEKASSEDREAAAARGNAVATYLAIAASRAADYGSSLCTWRAKDSAMRSTLARQALPMVWDFAEGSPFGQSSSGFVACVDVICDCLAELCPGERGVADQRDAARLSLESSIFCTDPPYYDNIGYADLSDFFYVWLRRSLRKVHPGLFETMLTPKDPELIATPYRERANGQSPEEFFESGLRNAFTEIRARQVDSHLMTLFYAFKQTETDDSSGATASTGWDTMLAGLLGAGLSVDATWPLRTEGDNRQVGIGNNALASSIVLTCRERPANAPLGTRSEFLSTLERELPSAIGRLQDASIAPVDLAQSAIGPGMAVFSRFAKVLEPDGSAMTVRTALGLINQVLDEVLAAEESEMDADTRWAVTWFTQYAFGEALYGEAEVLATARNTSITGLERAGILAARGGKVRLLKRSELEDGWDPAGDDRFTVWEACQHLIKRYEEGGEKAAADLLRRLGAAGDAARALAYRLYQHCERARNADEARAYNGLVIAWPRLAALSSVVPSPEPGTTGRLDYGEGTT